MVLHAKIYINKSLKVPFDLGGARRSSLPRPNHCLVDRYYKFKLKILMYNKNKRYSYNSRGHSVACFAANPSELENIRKNNPKGFNTFNLHIGLTDKPFDQNLEIGKKIVKKVNQIIKTGGLIQPEFQDTDFGVSVPLLYQKNEEGQDCISFLIELKNLISKEHTLDSISYMFDFLNTFNGVTEYTVEPACPDQQFYTLEKILKCDGLPHLFNTYPEIPAPGQLFSGSGKGNKVYYAALCIYWSNEWVFETTVREKLEGDLLEAKKKTNLSYKF
jgi:hypothetical protein